MRRVLTSPSVHFVILGALLYVTQGVWNPAVEPAADSETMREIHVAPLKLEELRANFRRTTGRDPTQEQLDALVRDFADREILYREALARGLDKGDRSVKWRLIQKMRFLEGREQDDPNTLYREAVELGLDRDDIVIRRLLIEKMRLLIKLGAVSEPPPESTLAEFYEKNAEDYRQPARVSLQHVFFSNDRRKQATQDDAAALLDLVRNQSVPPADAVKMGDVFALGYRFRNNSEHNLAKLFGPEFAKSAIALSPGEWHGPIRSAYGYHLVLVEDREQSALPGLGPVRNQVLQRYLAELRDAELAKKMETLREQYAVIVDTAPGERG